MKKLYFLCGLPRCGNTLLASIMNQNYNLTVTAKSVSADILYNLSCIKTKEHFENFPDHYSLDTLIKESLQIYYRHWQAENIIDRSPWGTPRNIELIEKYLTKHPKFIILERPFIEILSSFARIKNWQKDEVEELCYYEMTQGITARFAYAINNILKSKHQYIRITYDELVDNPKKVIESIYDFLGIPVYSHRYTDLEQISINNIKYDDSVLAGIHHDVREDSIQKMNYDMLDYLTPSIINKYKNVEISFES